MSTISFRDIAAPWGLGRITALNRVLRGAALGAAALLLLAAATSSAIATAASGPAALCPANTQPATVWNGDFEAGAVGWVASRALPLEPLVSGEPGQLGGGHWHLPAPALAGQAWRGNGLAWADTFPGGAPTPIPTDSSLAMAGDVKVPENARLTFVHRFNFETAKDENGYSEQTGAGQVEYSLDGGASWADVARPGADSLFAGAGAGGYNGKVRDDLPLDRANPLAGQPAFTGRSSTDLQYRSSHLDLSPLAGKQVRLRFRVATAGLSQAKPPIAGELRGWAVDDVHIYRCQTVPDEADGPASSHSPLPVGSDANARRLRAGTIALAVLRRPYLLRPSTRARLRVRLSNSSSRAVSRIRICFKAPRRLIAGGRCVLVRRLPGSATAEIDFPVKVQRAAARRKAVRIVFRARLGGDTVAKAARRYRIASPPELP